ncbi:MAG: ATP-binding cassette domain-containing protein [Planctomycetaceae bacterium]
MSQASVDARPQPAATRAALSRAFPARDLFRRPACWSLVWSICGGLALGALLATGLTVLLLLETGGRLAPALTESEAVRCNEITGVDVAATETADLGLRPLVWAARDTMWEGPLVALYSVPAFQSNLAALLTLMLCGVLLAVAFRGLLLSARRSALRAGLDVATRLRRSLHRQALRVGPGDVLDSDQTFVIDLFAGNAGGVCRAVENRVYVLGSSISQVAAILTVALLLDWRVALQCFIPLACCWYLFVRFRRRAAERRNAAEASMRDELARLSEGFAKTRIIRGYGMESSDHRQFQQDLDDHHRHVLQSSGKRDWERWQVCVMACVAAVIVLFFVGNRLLQSGGPGASFPFAAAVLMTVLTGLPYRPIKRLTDLRRDWNAASPEADAIYRYVDRIPDVSQAVGAKFLQPLSNALQFESVTCEIPGRGRVLDGIDMRLPAGRIYAFVSLDPLQALTLAYLLPRFIEPKSGRVLVDGNDIAWVTLESLRAETAYAGGRDPILTGTVLENIRCGNEHRSLQDVTDAAKTVHAHKFISRLPMGYETRLGHKGRRLDPGQSFRLSLARALLNDPALLIIEEPPDPLDADTKALLDDAYNRILRGRTAIFLPSRLSTVRRADGIVVLHEGKVAAVGKHQTLASSSPLYRHWEYSRFNEFRNGCDL